MTIELGGPPPPTAEESAAQVKSVVRSALMNFAHGRRVFALQQLEALVGEGPWCSETMAWIEGRCLLRKGHER